MILFLPRLRPASLSAETRRLSAEMKIPSAEMEKSQASALKDGSLSAEAQAPSEGDICLRPIVHNPSKLLATS